MTETIDELGRELMDSHKDLLLATKARLTFPTMERLRARFARAHNAVLAALRERDERIAELEAQRDAWRVEALARFDRIEELEERLSQARWDYDEAMQQHDDQRRRACEAEAAINDAYRAMRRGEVAVADEILRARAGKEQNDASSEVREER